MTMMCIECAKLEAQAALGHEIASKPEFTMQLALSTAHLTRHTRELLDTDELMAYAKREYGWWVYSGDQADPDTLPEDLAACVKFAQKHGCDWLMFDVDVQMISQLKVYPL